MKPITENITKPAKTLVEQLRMDTIRTSLQHLTRINETVIKSFWLDVDEDVLSGGVWLCVNGLRAFIAVWLKSLKIEQVSNGIKLTVLMIVITYVLGSNNYDSCCSTSTHLTTDDRGVNVNVC